MTDALPDDLYKQRVLLFAPEPAGQADRALSLLSTLPHLSAMPGPQPDSVMISYHLEHHTLDEIEHVLSAHDLRLAHSALGQIGHKLIHYREEVESHNLGIPPRNPEARKTEVFARAYDHHLHGDHDDTPPELREYK